MDSGSSTDLSPADREVAPGVYRFGTRRVNWYLLEDDDGLTVVDTGLPSHWQQFVEGLHSLDYALDDVRACLLTHAHPDHIGFAARLHDRTSVPVRLHGAGRSRANNGGEPPLGGFITHLWRPAVLRFFLEIARSGGTSVDPVTEIEPIEDGGELAVPGSPRVIHVPGHTEDEVVFFLADRGILFCGDAFTTVDIRTWRGSSPQLMPRWINVDHDQARATLGRLTSLGEVVMLPGHGGPWTGEITEAIRSASAPYADMQ